MAFTFTAGAVEPGTGNIFYTATTDTNSAAGTINPGFEPVEIIVINTTTTITHRWLKGMAAGTANKVVAAGTQTTVGSNGITVAGPNSASPVLPTVTLGTDLHINSASYVILLKRGN